MGAFKYIYREISDVSAIYGVVNSRTTIRFMTCRAAMQRFRDFTKLSCAAGPRFRKPFLSWRESRALPLKFVQSRYGLGQHCMCNNVVAHLWFWPSFVTVFVVLMLCVLCWGGVWTDLWEEWLLASVTTRYLLFQLIACRSVVWRIRCRGILIWISVTTRFSQMKRPCLWKTSSSFHWWSNKLLCIRVTTRFACLCGIVQFPFPTTVHWHCEGWRAWKRSSGPVIFSRENMSALWMISLWRVMPVRSLLMRYIGMMGFCGTYHIMVLYIPGRTNWELFLMPQPDLLVSH